MTTLIITRPVLDTDKNSDTIIAQIIRALKGRARTRISSGKLAQLDDRMLRDMGLVRR